jgi:hypothetical protein
MQTSRRGWLFNKETLYLQFYKVLLINSLCLNLSKDQLMNCKIFLRLESTIDRHLKFYCQDCSFCSKLSSYNKKCKTIVSHFVFCNRNSYFLVSSRWFHPLSGSTCNVERISSVQSVQHRKRCINLKKNYFKYSVYKWLLSLVRNLSFNSSIPYLKR